MSAWVVFLEYDIEKIKTNIVRVEPYKDFVKRGPVEILTLIRHTRIVDAVDALDAWKIAREKYHERY